MDFAKRQLEKYGWSEGQGLGKDLTGMKTALKPKIKMNTFGLGHDMAQELTYRWWEDAFNDAASNVLVKNSKDGVRVDTAVEDSIEVPAVKRSIIKRDKLKFSSFMKAEILTTRGIEPNPEKTSEETERVLPKTPTTLTDEELFQACGGLTAHKAARHGHKLSGKLQRVREQEEAMLKALQDKKSEDCKDSDSSKEKKKNRNELHSSRKEKKRKNKHASNSGEIIEEETREVLCEENTSEKKKKKKKKSKNPGDVEALTVENDSTTNQVPYENEIAEKRKKKRKESLENGEENEMCVIGHDSGISEKQRKKNVEVSCDSFSKRKKKRKTQET